MSDQIFTEEELQQAVSTGKVDPNLPPPGAERRNVLAERQDALEEQAEIAFENVEAMDPKVLEPDREIQYEIENDFMKINIGPAYVVKWVYTGQNSQKVWQAKAEGWQIISPDMLVDKVDRMLVKEDNTLRVGDVVAMYIRKDKHFLLEQKRKMRQLRQQFGAEAELHELAGKNPKALKVRNFDEDNPHASQIQARAARKTAMRHLGNKMKQGTIPGVPIK